MNYGPRFNSRINQVCFKIVIKCDVDLALVVYLDPLQTFSSRMVCVFFNFGKK